MDLVIHQVVKLQIIHMSDRGRTVERLTGAAVPQLNLAVPADRNSLPQIPVIPVVIQIFQHGREQFSLVLCLKGIPVHIDVVVGQFQRILDICLVGAVKDGR